MTLIALEILKQILQELATAAHTSLAFFPGGVYGQILHASQKQRLVGLFLQLHELVICGGRRYFQY